MKCTIERRALLAGLGLVAEAVSATARLPILKHVLITARADHLVLSASDLEVTLESVVPAKGDRQGAITAPFQTLMGICRSLPADATVNLASEGGGKLRVQSGRSRFGMPTVNPDDFPASDELENAEAFALPAMVLAELLDRARHAMPQVDPRHYLNGIFLEGASPTLTTVATNGHMLIQVIATVPEETVLPTHSVILAVKGVRACLKVLGACSNAEALAQVAWDYSHIKIRVGDTTVTSKLIDGKYPDYRRFIPSYRRDTGTTVRVDKQNLAPLLDRMALMAETDGNMLGGIRLTVEPGVLKADARSTIGKATDSVDAECTGVPREFGVNVNYLRGILAAIRQNEVQMIMDGEDRAALIQGVLEGVPQTDTIAVLMPMRL